MISKFHKDVLIKSSYKNQSKIVRFIAKAIRQNMNVENEDIDIMDPK